MNRSDFMTQLKRLLQGIPSAEREEALQYYNDYFDDAGEEQEQAVIEALGNPARVAENIRRDLADSGVQPRAKASDKALVEYGKDSKEEEPDEPRAKPAVKESELPTKPAPRERERETGRETEYGDGERSESKRDGGYGGEPGSSGRKGRSLAGWAVILIVIGAVFASPVAMGALGVLFGLAVSWLCIILIMGVMAIAMFILSVCMAVTGILCLPADPLAGVAVIGGGLICGGLGILFLMVTVALAGIVTPAFFRGIAWLFRGRKRMREA
ncbi:MAG: DUF1700 domain-containing protein [bacterium]|nr:DUF1700 domain-containing protein [bacterium]